MALFLSMLPFYLLGNLHCLGMCGPMVMMLAKHRWRYAYFFGRLLSFSLAGALAGGVGAVLALTLQSYRISAIVSFFFGGVILAAGMAALVGMPKVAGGRLSKLMAKLSAPLAALSLKEGAAPIFLFGFFTLFLPCGQTIIVFSACALYGDVATGFLNGFVFALLTSPSLLLAMHAFSWVQKGKGYYNRILGGFAIVVALLAFCRGFAEMGVIPHWVLNPNAPEEYHIVMY